jgi:hypothetical protein
MKLSQSTSTLLALGLLTAGIVPAACSLGNPEAAGGESFAQASAAISQVPPQVACVEIVATGSRTVDSKFAVTSGQSALLNMTALPPGSVTFEAYAYPAACSAVTTTGASATWISAPVTTTLSAGTVTSVNMTLQLNGGAAVGIVFGEDSGAEASVPDASKPLPANPPQVFNSGGPVLASPKIVAVLFGGDALTSQLTDFTTKIGTSSYWTAATSEYGVAAATFGGTVLSSSVAPASISDAQIQTFLANGVASGTLPTPSANTLYVVYYPTGTSVTAGSAISCVSFSGYHSQTTIASTSVAYVVIPRCASLGSLTGISAVTAAASSQLVAAATDPLPASNPAWATVDPAHLEWQLAFGGGEVSSMCAQMNGVFTTPSDLPYEVQRTWSNAAARAGQDPCVPAPAGEVYFNSEPQFPGTVSGNLNGQTVNVAGLQIAPGTSATVNLDLFSNGVTTGPWTVNAISPAMQAGDAGTPELTFSFNQTTGQNGSVIQMTINVAGSASPSDLSTFVVESTLGSQTNVWLGAVKN